MGVAVGVGEARGRTIGRVFHQCETAETAATAIQEVKRYEIRWADLDPTTGAEMAKFTLDSRFVRDMGLD